MLTHLGTSPIVYGLDIETDTTPETPEELAAGYAPGNRGLDPRIGSVVNVGISVDRDQNFVFRGSEYEILMELDTWFDHAWPGIIATWNGAGFDIPFLAHRFRKHGIIPGMRSRATDELQPKYQALPESGGCHTMHWEALRGPHAHFDISYAYQPIAAAAGVKHSLKPVARAAGIEMVEVDRTRIDLLTRAEQDRYVASDANGTRELALRWLAGNRTL